MATASINFKAVKSSSELHNKREVELDYNFKSLEKNNESFISKSIEQAEKEIQISCKKISGRKLQKNATPIREAVVNLNANHGMSDLKKLADDFKKI